jgi:hypothetical protein
MRGIVMVANGLPPVKLDMRLTHVQIAAVTIHGVLKGWPRADILALIGIIIAVVIAAIPSLRKGLLRVWRRALLRAGFPRRKYAKWFVRQWGIYENPYLDDKESLDLRNTYVPLSFRSNDSGNETLSLATDILDNTNVGNLLIEGGPGSGKSTLLKAYGVGILQGRQVFWSRQTVPFIIQLRKLARFLNDQNTVADYLVREILVSSVGMSYNQATQLLRFSLYKGQVLVMLDGLDEVTANRYQRVLEAVIKLISDRQPDCPTYRARIIITCRRQNFLSIRDDWISAVKGQACSLAPLRNSEIFNYLAKLRSKFKTTNGPENFMQAVRASGTLDLHRVPLILAMSVGLYSRKEYFEIPSSIAKLYQDMINEMLERHRFKGDLIGSALTFQTTDKYRFLREFALHIANKNDDDFEEFSKFALIEFAKELAPDLNAVSEDQTEEFVNEILERSGLLNDVAENGQYVFAHRSIHEYLVAEELQISDEGSFLLDRALSESWRQVIQFYTAALEQRQVSVFLEQLSQLNPELAGFCLGNAKASDQAASIILDAIEPTDGIRLRALAAATMSPRVAVQRMAVDRLKDAISRPLSPLTAIKGEVDGMLPLLGSLAGTNAAEIAALVPHIIRHVPDDPRLVDPLWRCLAAPDIEKLPACHFIVQRLLALAADPNGLDELARQESYTRNFITPELRRKAYPFTGGLDAGHNLVTLLGWADYLKVTPTEPNRFFEAKAANRLAQVEGDLQRTITFSPFKLVKAWSYGTMLIAFIIALIVAFKEPGQFLKPFGWWTVPIIIAASLLPSMITILVLFWMDEICKNARLKELFGTQEDLTSTTCPWVGSLLLNISVIGRALAMSMFIIGPIFFGVAALPLLSSSLIAYLLIVGLASLSYLIPIMKFSSRGRHYYIYRPNPYIDIYDDPNIRHWIRA